MRTNKELEAARFVGCSRNGTPPTVPSGDIQHMRFEIYNFAARGEAQGKHIATNTLKAHGHEWYLNLYPRGHSESSQEKEYISVFLGANLRDHESFDVDCTFKFGNEETTMLNKRTFAKNSSAWGWRDWIPRESLLSTCLDQNGTLAIDVYIELYVTDKPTIWYPATLPKTESFLSQLYTDEETKDIDFLLQNDKYSVHKLVLRSRAPVLYDLANDFQADDTSTMLEIPHVDGAAFDNFIKYMYTVLDTEEAFQDINMTMKMLQAADRFGYIDLKLFAESVLVDKFLKVQHWSDLLLLTDSHSLPLLQEAAFQFYGSKPASCQQSNGWSKVTESAKILTELLQFQASSKSCKIPGRGLTKAKDIDSLDVTTLREQLEKEKLDLDGSREMLVARLKNHLFPPPAPNTRLAD